MPVRGKILCRLSTAQMSAPAGIYPYGKFTAGPDKDVVLVSLENLVREQMARAGGAAE